jgi:hypothetical protein
LGVGESIEFVNRTFGMGPAEAMLADIDPRVEPGEAGVIAGPRA